MSGETQPSPISDNRLKRVAAKMWNEGAESVSDSEIERCLSGCVAKTRVIAWAKSLRDEGRLTMDYVCKL